jgi:hypothetical protein
VLSSISNYKRNTSISFSVFTPTPHKSKKAAMPGRVTLYHTRKD